jgi:H+-translocating NAD(P) transhydrogenase subunit alpha
LSDRRANEKLNIMKISILRETFPGERRVALVPASIAALRKAGCQVLVESEAGRAAGYVDDEYRAKDAQIVDRTTALAADVVLAVRLAGANTGARPSDPSDPSDSDPSDSRSGLGEFGALRAGQILIGSCDPLGRPEVVQQMAGTGVTLFGLELIPRITRAQSMDILSSMATVAGYRAVLLAALELPQMFPLMMTAAGTLSPARVFVIGAGVAGLQAIATARRLGAVVQAYDVRPAAREQCESLGAKFVELPLETGQSEGQGGYAKAMDEAFYQRQRQLMADVVAHSDAVITTAAIPGRPSPRLITAEAVAGMHPGSVIIDLAAERGGNCELSRPDERVVEHGVTILGPTNLPAEVPRHASQMYAKNITTFLLHLLKDQQLHFDLNDEITRDTLLTRDGQVVHGRLREILKLDPLPDTAATADPSASADENPNRQEG